MITHMPTEWRRHPKRFPRWCGPRSLLQHLGSVAALGAMVLCTCMAGEVRAQCPGTHPYTRSGTVQTTSYVQWGVGGWNEGACSWSRDIIYRCTRSTATWVCCFTGRWDAFWASGAVAKPAPPPVVEPGFDFLTITQTKWWCGSSAPADPPPPVPPNKVQRHGLAPVASSGSPVDPENPLSAPMAYLEAADGMDAFEPQTCWPQVGYQSGFAGYSNAGSLFLDLAAVGRSLYDEDHPMPADPVENHVELAGLGLLDIANQLAPVPFDPTPFFQTKAGLSGMAWHPDFVGEPAYDAGQAFLLEAAGHMEAAGNLVSGGLTTPLEHLLFLDELESFRLALRSYGWAIIAAQIAALPVDCNENVVSDGEDIALGISLDANANFVPDECEPCGYGDLNGDGFVNANDLLCDLDRFAGLSQSPACQLESGNFPPFDVLDIAPCGGNGFINVEDILAILDAFSGDVLCPCATAAVTERADSQDSAVDEPDPLPSARKQLQPSGAYLRLVPRQAKAPSGGLVTIDAFVSAAVDLRAYQLALHVSGTGQGRLTFVSAEMESDHPDPVFGDEPMVSAVDARGGRILAALYEGGVDALPSRYLGTFTFRASPEARGLFRISLRVKDGTMLRDSDSEPIPFRASHALVQVGAKALASEHRSLSRD